MITVYEMNDMYICIVILLVKPFNWLIGIHSNIVMMAAVNITN